MSEKIESLEEKIESFKDIHFKLFPRAKPGSQIAQLNEELTELFMAETGKEYFEEFGDVLFVATSLLRFPTTESIGKFIINSEIYKKKPNIQEYAIKALCNSIEKCKKRVSENRYKFVNGIYKRDKSI